MAAVTWSEVSYEQAPPPLKLAIAQEMNRRDSLSSSRTGDSGYNSDPDISLSPLDFVSTEQVPYTSAAFTFDSSALFDVKDAISSKPKRLTTNALLFKKPQENKQGRVPPKIDVTSAPTHLSDKTDPSKPGWTTAVKKHDPEDHPTADIKQWININLQPHQPQERNLSIVSLSSTGSCDMYSNADDNSEDEDAANSPPSTLSKATLKTIELIMRKIELNLSYAAFMQCAGSQSSRAQGNAGNTSRTGRGGSQSGGSKRKSRIEDTLPPDDQDEDGTNKRRRISITTTTEDSESGPRFACPFFKHDPNRYRNRRTCPGPGWPTVHRMKEHLYRSHAQPIFCNRCYQMFDSDNELSSHQRADPCPVSAPQSVDGIGRETLKGLRKRSPALRLEEDKWRDTYQLLFPDVSAEDIPSPYYDSASPSEGSRRFRRELLERVRQELFATAEREPGPVEQRLLRQVAGIIQRCESELLGTTPNTAALIPDHTFLHPTMPTHRRASAPSILVEEPSPSQLQPGNALPGFTNEPNYNAPFPPPQNGPLSPRTPHTFGVLPQAMDDTPFPPSGLGNAYMEPFSTGDWIDWSSVFPPGSDLQFGERTEAQPTLVPPVWT